jgi:cytochrome c oxidase subunit 3
MTTTAPNLILDSQSGPPPNLVLFSLQLDRNDPYRLLRRYRLGLALYIASVVMLFVGFSSAYVVRRGIPTYESASATYSQSWEPLQLPMRLLLINTLVLVGASFAMERARRQTWAIAGKEANGPEFVWIFFSLLLSVSFVVGQGIAWRSLWLTGHLVTSGARTAFFYVLTGTHAFHAVAGIAALTWIASSSKRWLPLKAGIRIDLLTWYMHAMSLLWIYLFVFLLFA